MFRNTGTLGLVFYGVLLGLSLGLSGLLPEVCGWSWTGDLGVVPEGPAGLVVGAATALVSLGIARFSERGYWLSRRLALATRSLPTWSLGPLALAAGMAEEAWFRGTLWTPLEYGLGETLGRPAALLLTSISFGWVHGAGRPGLRTWTLFAFAIGLVLGALRWWTGGLLAPMVAHATVDLINLPLLRFGTPPLSEEDP